MGVQRKLSYFITCTVHVIFNSGLQAEFIIITFIILKFLIYTVVYNFINLMKTECLKKCF
jgi:hypothetical protein